jgi:hypothetical protein
MIPPGVGTLGRFTRIWPPEYGDEWLNLMTEDVSGRGTGFAIPKPGI